jgi:hypothetical protein
MNRLKSRLHSFHVIKAAKPQARRVLLASASDELTKATIECVIYTLNGNHKLFKEEQSKLRKYKKSLRVLVNQNFGFRN